MVHRFFKRQTDIHHLVRRYQLENTDQTTGHFNRQIWKSRPACIRSGTLDSISTAVFVACGTSLDCLSCWSTSFSSSLTWRGSLDCSKQVPQTLALPSLWHFFGEEFVTIICPSGKMARLRCRVVCPSTPLVDWET